jgi:hypothetical protein
MRFPYVWALQIHHTAFAQLVIINFTCLGNNTHVFKPGRRLGKAFLSLIGDFPPGTTVAPSGSNTGREWLTSRFPPSAFWVRQRRNVA